MCEFPFIGRASDLTTKLSAQGEHFKLVAGLVPGENLFSDVSSANNARAFVGVVEYQLTDPSK